MTESILEEAQRIIHGDRNVAYGHPRDNFAAIAAQWNAYLNHMGDRELNSLDVANLMVLMKVARVVNGVFHRDSYTDMAGYAGTGERLQEPVLTEQPTSGTYTVAIGDESQTFNVAGARQWDSLADLSKDVKVRGQGGEVWKWFADHGDWLWSCDGQPVNYGHIGEAPFTEILEEYEV